MKYRPQLALLAVLAIPCSAFGQSQTVPSQLHRVPSAPIPITYDLREGVVAQAPHQARFGPETIFDNTDGQEYYFINLPLGEEWIDECAFAADDLDGLEQIDGFTFEYCTSLAPTVDLDLAIYSDTVIGSGPSSWPAAQCAYGLAGLPGTFGGLPACWAVTIDLEGGFECTVPQESVPGGSTDFVGIGYEMTGGDIGLIPDSLLGPGGPAVPGYGSQDSFEAFDASGHLGTFNFGGGPRVQGSFNLKLYGDGILDTKVINHDVPDVGDTLRLKSDAEFRPGSQVTYTLDNANAGTFGIVFATALNPLQPSIAPGVTLLLDAGSVIAPPSPALMSAGPNATFTTPVLPGLPPTVYAQAFEFSSLPLVPGNVIAGSNALKHDN